MDPSNMGDGSWEDLCLLSYAGEGNQLEGYSFWYIMSFSCGNLGQDICAMVLLSGHLFYPYTLELLHGFLNFSQIGHHVVTFCLVQPCHLIDH